MSKRDTLKGLAVGLIVGGLLVGQGTYAADVIKKKIEVVYSGIQVFRDGTRVVLRDHHRKEIEPFVSGGVVYVPLSVIGSFTKDPVTYDAKNHKVDIGMITLKNGNVGLTEVFNKFGLLDDDIYADHKTNYHSSETGLPSMKDSFTVGGVRYTATNSLHRAGHTKVVWTFKRMTGMLAIADWMPKNTTGQLRILADDKVIFDRTIRYGDPAVKVDLDLKGVNSLRFENSENTEFFNVELTPVWKTTELP